MRAFRALPLPLALLALDRLLKAIALDTSRPVAGGVFVLHRNSGIAFSIALPDAVMAIGIAIAFAVVGVAAVRAMQREAPRPTPFFLILAGALSNVCDRVRYGAVIDYFAAPRVGFYFNLADLMILTGILLLLFRHPSQFLKDAH